MPASEEVRRSVRKASTRHPPFPRRSCRFKKPTRPKATASAAVSAGVCGAGRNSGSAASRPLRTLLHGPGRGPPRSCALDLAPPPPHWTAWPPQTSCHSTAPAAGPTADDGLHLRSFRIPGGLEANITLDKKYCAFPGGGGHCGAWGYCVACGQGTECSLGDHPWHLLDFCCPSRHQRNAPPSFPSCPPFQE